MSRIEPKPLAEIDGETADLLEIVRRRLGMIPNVMRTAAHSHPGITLLLQTFFALERSTLSPAFRELATIAVAAANGCAYCQAAHTALGSMIGVSDGELADAARGRSNDECTAVGLAFVRALVEKRGRVLPDEVRQVRERFSDAEVVDMIAIVGMHTFANYLNAVAQTEIDFPATAAA